MINALFMLRSKRKATHGVKCLCSFIYRHSVTREQEKLTTQMWFKVLKKYYQGSTCKTESEKKIKRKSFGKCLSFIYKPIYSGKQREILICIQIVVRRKSSCDGIHMKQRENRPESFTKYHRRHNDNIGSIYSFFVWGAHEKCMMSVVVNGPKDIETLKRQKNAINFRLTAGEIFFRLSVVPSDWRLLWPWFLLTRSF